MLPVACAGRSSLLHEQQKGAAFQMACSSSLRHEASSEPRLGMTRILAIVVRAQVGLLRVVGNGLLWIWPASLRMAVGASPTLDPGPLRFSG